MLLISPKSISCSLAFIVALLLSITTADACSFCEAFVGETPQCCFTSGSSSSESQSTDGIVGNGTAITSNFSTFGGRWPQPGGLGSDITVTYSYNNFLDGGLKNLAGESISESYLKTVTEEAFGLWASVAPIHFIEVADVGTPVFTSNSAAYLSYAEDDFGQIRLNHRFINGTDAQNGGPTTKALAYAISSAGNLSADIHFDNGDPWEIIGTPTEPDVLGILTHEIGHSLGMGHSTIEGTVMNPAALRRMGPGTGILLPDDIAGIQSLYGIGIGSVTALSIPEPSSFLLLLAASASVVRRHRFSNEPSCVDKRSEQP